MFHLISMIRMILWKMENNQIKVGGLLAYNHAQTFSSINHAQLCLGSDLIQLIVIRSSGRLNGCSLIGFRDFMFFLALCHYCSSLSIFTDLWQVVQNIPLRILAMVALILVPIVRKLVGVHRKKKKKANHAFPIISRIGSHR